MNRSPCLALAALTAIAVVAPAQEPTPAEAAYARLEEKIAEVERAPAATRAKRYEELFTECGAFLDAHLEAATDDQLTRAGGLWLTLAERLRQPEEAVRRRIAALRARRAPEELQELLLRAEAKLGLKPGGAAPAWSAADLVDGRQVSLEGLRGKRVLMVFWATISEHSVRLLQDRVRALHQRHAADGLVVIAVGTSVGGESAAAEKGLVEELRWPWPKVFDARGEIAQAYGVEAVPHVALIDGEGKLVAIGPAQTAMTEVDRAVAERSGGAGR